MLQNRLLHHYLCMYTFLHYPCTIISWKLSGPNERCEGQSMPDVHFTHSLLCNHHAIIISMVGVFKIQIELHVSPAVWYFFLSYNYH